MIIKINNFDSRGAGKIREPFLMRTLSLLTMLVYAFKSLVDGHKMLAITLKQYKSVNKAFL